MISLVHIVNPFHAEEGSDLARAQPITFESMRRAKQAAEKLMGITLMSAQFEEDQSAVPDGFRATKNLIRSTHDVEGLPDTLKLPFITDILDRGLQQSDAEWIIYTNVDIGLKPDFYQWCLHFIKQGYDAFIINRRRIPTDDAKVYHLDEIYREAGRSHPGFDCFVVRRDVLEKFSLADIAIGVPFIGIAMAQNVFALAEKPRVFDDRFLTFHLGMELFAKRAPRPFVNYNRAQFRRAMEPLYPMMDSRKWPYGNRSFPERMMRWGLNPSLPIKLALRLEPRRWR